jgi:alcohol dehydrogenase
MTTIAISPEIKTTDLSPAQNHRSDGAAKKMKALVYHGPGKKSWEDKPRPVILEPTDAVVKILKTTICGTDLHIMKGDVPEVTPGRIIGHEGVGVVEEAGSAVSNFKKGDHVLISCITSCGKCDYCKKGLYSLCGSREHHWPPSFRYKAFHRPF